MKKFSLILALLCLVGCAANPVSYIEPKKAPIVNIEAELAERVEIEATANEITLNNRIADDVGLVYKLFWYDSLGVSQPVYTAQGEQESTDWQNVWLHPLEKRQIAIEKLNEESHNYRIYLRGAR